MNVFPVDNNGSDEDDEDDQNIDSVYVPSRDDAASTFTGHNKPVFCGSFHPTDNLCVTGGEDDKAFVWAGSDMPIYTASNHKDSVIAAEFSSSKLQKITN